MYTKNYEIAKLLIEAGADIEAPNDIGKTLLSRVIMKHDFEATKLLVEKGANVNGNGERETPLMNATRFNYVDIVAYLIEKGADPSPALLFVSSIEALNLLLKDKRCNINYQAPNNGMSALHRAAFYNYLDIMKALLTHPDQKINIDAQDADGTTALLRCGQDLFCLNGNYDSIKLLISHGANIYIKNARGRSILHNAVQYGDLGLCKLLVEQYHMEPTSQYHTQPDGDTLLISAVSKGDIEISKWLVKNSFQTQQHIECKNEMT